MGDYIEIFGGPRKEPDEEGASRVFESIFATLNQAGRRIPLMSKLKVLEKLGFSFSLEALERMEEQEDVGYADLLGLVGMGDFDLESGAWQPLSDQVYALDTEVYDIGTMYPDFFRGLLSISKGEVPITEVAQDDSGVDWERGEGTFLISLRYNGRPYTIEARAQCDWLDCSVLEKVNGILEQEGNPKRYYAMWNNYQGFTVLFMAGPEAERFERLTGCRLSTAL